MSAQACGCYNAAVERLALAHLVWLLCRMLLLIQVCCVAASAGTRRCSGSCMPHAARWLQWQPQARGCVTVQC
jgi:hypothetical protein